MKGCFWHSVKIYIHGIPGQQMMGSIADNKQRILCNLVINSLKLTWPNKGEFYEEMYDKLDASECIDKARFSTNIMGCYS